MQHRNKNHRNRGSRNKMVSTIDPQKLVKKATQTKEDEFVSTLTFTDFNLHEKLERNITSKGYKRPTEIQEKSMSSLIEGNDMIGIAATGTGKTGAFLIPIIHQMLEDKNTTALVVVPTRELAQQVQDEYRSLTNGLEFHSSCFIGGTNVGKDITNARRNNRFIVATPGRLNDLIDRGALTLHHTSILVLDEFDRMLDMGFVNDILKISELLPPQKQTLFFSATMDGKIKQLAKKLLNNPKEINLAIAKPAEGINQVAFLVYDLYKIQLLEHYLNHQEVKNMIVFASRKVQVDQITRKLGQLGFSVVAMHSDKTQEERNEAIRLFKSGKYEILVATDIVSRGIDIDDLSHVVNFDVPSDAADYVHRIGRTARAGKDGAGITFISPEDQLKFTYIEKLIEREVDKYLTPEEIGESPEFNPQAQNTKHKGKKRYRNNNKNRNRKKRPPKNNNSKS